MPRVVVSRNSSDLEDAPVNCPVQAFRRGPNGELVIDPNVCIDCGVCQTVSAEGSIQEDSSASQEDIEYNSSNAESWEQA